VIPDSPFNHPIGSFQRPVPPPTVDPDASPTCTVSISQQWIPFIIGALWQLVQPTTWRAPDDATLLLTQQRAMSLITLFNCGSGLLPFFCPGDAGLSASPYATWAVDSGCGVWTPFQGYNAEDCGPFGSHDFRQAAVTITFPNPVTLTSVSLRFDLIPGNFSVPSTFDEVYITDVTHSTVLKALTVADLVSGDGQELFWTGSVAGVSEIELVVTSDEVNTGGSRVGMGRIEFVDTGGYGLSPC